MMYFLPTRFALTDSMDRLGIFLTLLFFSIYPLHALSAGTNSNANFVSYSTRYNNVVDANEQSQRIGLLLDYAKKEAPHLLPGLPSIVRDPASWAFGGLQNVGDFFDFAIPSKDDGDTLASIFRPVASFMRPAAPDESQATWFAPTYHHRHGVLPMHDALVLGTHSRQDMLGGYMRFDLHPYLAQGIASQGGYWGAEVTMDLATPTDHAYATKPWGRLVLGYSNGDGKLMDHGHGIDLHGEVRFSDHLSLNTGVRQSDSSANGNYALLQWKMPLE